MIFDTAKFVVLCVGPDYAKFFDLSWRMFSLMKVSGAK